MAIEIKNSNDNLVFHKIDRQTPHCEVLFDFSKTVSHISGKKFNMKHKKFVRDIPSEWLLVEFDGRYVNFMFRI